MFYYACFVFVKVKPCYRMCEIMYCMLNHLHCLSCGLKYHTCTQIWTFSENKKMVTLKSFSYLKPLVNFSSDEIVIFPRWLVYFFGSSKLKQKSIDYNK